MKDNKPERLLLGHRSRLRPEAEPGLADNGELEGDLMPLFEQVGIAARYADKCVVLFIDELQYVKEPQFAASSRLCTNVCRAVCDSPWSELDCRSF